MFIHQFNPMVSGSSLLRYGEGHRKQQKKPYTVCVFIAPILPADSIAVIRA
jgi:hypothetical protein